MVSALLAPALGTVRLAAVVGFAVAVARGGTTMAGESLAGGFAVVEAVTGFVSADVVAAGFSVLVLAASGFSSAAFAEAGLGAEETGAGAVALAAEGFTSGVFAAGEDVDCASEAFVAVDFSATACAAAPDGNAAASEDLVVAVVFFAAVSGGVDAAVLAAGVRVVGVAAGAMSVAALAEGATDASGVLPVAGLATRWLGLLGWPIFLPVVFARAVMALLLFWGKRSNTVEEYTAGVPDCRMSCAVKRDARGPAGNTSNGILHVRPGAAAQDHPLRIHPFLRQVQPT
ncbi:hypothetical protein DQ353_03460 [Arthrobacter sp. AQ5-05]|nr:hypothetical protein DQ353_03460 [Arthrobacter sp. AQ5-05]